MRYLTVRNFEKFQHYKNASDKARPAWIKLYASLLHDFDFSELSDDAKGHLIMIWLLVSQRTDRRIPYDAKWVARYIGAKSKIDLDSLVEAGFLTALEPNRESGLEPNRESGLEPNRDTALEQNRIEQNRREENKPTASGPSDPDPRPPSPNGNGNGKSTPSAIVPEDLVEAWNEHCVPLGLSRVDDLTTSRRKLALLRIREHPEPDFWERVFGGIRASPLLKGLVPPKVAGQRSWRVNFDWLLKDDNAVKIKEGIYLG